MVASWAGDAGANIRREGGLSSALSYSRAWLMASGVGEFARPARRDLEDQRRLQREQVVVEGTGPGVDALMGYTELGLQVVAVVVPVQD